jgi:hypothetical protein
MVPWWELAIWAIEFSACLVIVGVNVRRVLREERDEQQHEPPSS